MQSVSVIPLLRLPRRLHEFDYAVPPDMEGFLQIGDLVAIPFRNRKIQGIVCRISDQPSTRTLKPLTARLSEKPLFPSPQLLLIEWMATTYAVSRATIASLMIAPSPTRKRAAKKDIHSIPSDIPLRVSQESFQIPSKIWEKNLPLVVRTGRFMEIVNLIADVLSKNPEKQSLVLCPTQQDVEMYSHALENLLHSLPILPYHKELPITHVRRVQLQATEGTPCCIVGTRSAVLLPFANLGAITLTDAHSIEYKQYDQNPRYDARDIAFFRARTASCRLILTSPAPRMEEMYQVRSGKVQFLESESSAAPIADLSNELKKGHPPFISDKLLEGVQRAHEKNKASFLLLNRKGTSQLVQCRDCDHCFVCASCSSPATYHGATAALVCRTCGKTTALPPSCPDCQGVSYIYKGIGIEKYATLISPLFPETPIHTISKDDDHLEDADISNSIIIGTNAFPYRYKKLFSQIGFVAIVSADPIASPTDFRSTEYQWQMCAQILDIGRDCDAELLIQTFKSEGDYIKTLSHGNFESFADQELRERERFGWPPLSILIKILPLASANTRSLLPIIPPGTCTVVSCAPRELLLRCSSPIDGEIPRELQEWLTALPDDFLVDRNPIML